MKSAGSSSIRITVKNLQNSIPVSQKEVKAAIRKILSEENITLPAQITICFVDDKTIKEFNLRYLNADYPTDVIAFDSSCDNSEICADIMISAETAVTNAKIFKTLPLYELYLYLIHGILHILGYDDRTVRQRNTMQKRAEKILQMLHKGTRSPCLPAGRKVTRSTLKIKNPKIKCPYIKPKLSS